MIEKIQLLTTDNLILSALHYKVEQTSAGISLFHMMPSTKESYHNFAQKLQNSGIGALAVDLRGHGESQDGSKGYENYSDEQHQKSVFDIKAAVEFQNKEGHAPIFICGASIGANLCLYYLTQSKLVKKAILLSPGLNYKGIEAIPLAKKIPKDKEIFILAAKDDLRQLGTAAEQSSKIFEALKCQKQIEIFDSGGHGTQILESHPRIMDDLIKWLLG